MDETCITGDPSGSETETVHAGGTAPAGAYLDGFAAGDRFGRYVLTREIGIGGMGVVMAAYDPKLDRTVALKLLRPGTQHGATRLLREARALAQLQHPGVITVFEVGEVAQRHYISMEYVEGRTLMRWVAEEQPSWRKVLDVLRHAGGGLAAAHEAGLVHRDFKPTNVLVGDDGRVRVVDFGIATPRAFGHSEEGFSTPALERSPEDLTEDGIVVGTPPYMAPEQHFGRPIDASCDQFSFAVTAFECLFGKRPFSGKKIEEVSRQKLESEIEPIPRDSPVPRKIRDALLRGLAAEPSDRWPSMQEFLGQLRRRRVARGGAVVVAVAGLGVTATAFALAPEADDAVGRCQEGSGRAAEVWNSSAAKAQRAAFVETGLQSAEEVAGRVETWLDRYATEWADVHRRACDAAHVAQSIPPSELDLRMACLQKRIGSLQALVDVLATPDAQVVRKATQAAAALRPPLECETASAQRASLDAPADPKVRAQLQDLRKRLALAEAQGRAGKLSDGLATAESVMNEVADLDADNFRGEVELIVGKTASEVGDFERAEKILTASYHRATGVGDDMTAARSAGFLAYVVGYRQARIEEGLRWGRYANSAASRTTLDTREAAMIHSNIASIYFAKGDYAQAKSGLETALELRERGLGPDHPEVAVGLNNLGGLLAQQGKLDQARPLIQRALRIWEDQLGRRHPLVASSLMSLAAVLEREGEFAEAIPLLRRAVEIRGAEFGESNSDYASALDSLASVLIEMEQFKEAEALARKAKEIRFETLPDPHPHRAASLTNLGLALLELDRLDEAEPLLIDAIEMWRRTVGPNHPHAAYPKTGLGELYIKSGRYADAIEVLEQAQEARTGAVELGTLLEDTTRVLKLARAGAASKSE